ncbi:hypothetical protein R5W24_003745 [Gemmata sp. JC717]|uniref:hypothetical protein n=1 Tax=Gemmata algarum TaxID=2975278 RepID=UPI0021BACA02|nr:hypothetical protein [Gemmata algarum]MDY3554619.1 hypothetical protein [Gemmata algarum]
MNALFASAELFAELQRRGWFPAWLALLLAAVAVVAVGALYVFEAGGLGVVRRLLLAGVRVAVVLVVAFLLLRPTWVREDSAQRRRPVAVLIDVSQSMDQKDPRPAPEDHWRAALAFDLIEPNKPLPTAPPEKEERPSRFAVARAALTNPRLDLLNRLKAIGPLEVSTFGTTRSGGKDGNDLEWLKAQTPDQPRTALIASALELLNRDDNDLPAAVVVVTDGRENGGSKTFAELAERFRDRKVPLHVYGVGSSSFGQLRLRDASVPESVFQDDIVTVPVRYAVKGVAAGKVDIVVKFGDREVAAKRDIPVREGDDIREQLSFVPTQEDAAARRQEVTVTVTVRPDGPGARDPLTDTVTKPAQIITKKLQVLVVEGLPRKDFQFLMRALQRDRRVDARFFLTEGDRDAMRLGEPWLAEFTQQVNGTLALEREPFRKLINAYDLLIIGDIPGAFFTPDQQQVIKEFVTEGGGLIHIAGKVHAPHEWLSAETGRHTIADVLPVEAVPVKFPPRPPGGRYYQPFVPALAPSAIRSPLVALEDIPTDNAMLWDRTARTEAAEPPERASQTKQLQPMEWYYPVTRLKPGAEAFLVHPTQRTPGPDDRPLPLLAGHYYGKGYVLFSAFDDTWKWRFNEADRYFGRFWSQCVYQAGVPRAAGTKLTQVSLDTLEPVQGRTGQVYARVLDENFKALTADEVSATLERVGGGEDDKDARTPVKLQKLSGQDGEYVAPLTFSRAGRYKLHVSPGNRSPATLEYRVTLPPDHEQAPGSLAEAEMAKLAAESGSIERPGRFYREEDLHRLPDDVKAQFATFTKREEVVLWNRWPLFLLIGLLSVEWFLRKFSGLS